VDTTKLFAELVGAIVGRGVHRFASGDASAA